MPNQERQRVRFTGKRTGMEAIAIKGVGVVAVGDVIEISADEAEAWTTDLPMRNGETGSDWAKVGGVYDADDEKVARRMMKQQEKLSANAEEYLPAEVNTEAAHETAPDHGTVEEYAEVVTAEPAEEADDKKSSGKGKKGE